MEDFKPQKSKALAEELWKRVERELKDAGVEIIMATEMDAGPIFESYFDRKPPFGTGEKRKEFPDAFVVAALDNWWRKTATRCTSSRRTELSYVFEHLSEDLDRSVQVTAEVTILSGDRPNYVVEKTVINDGDSNSVDGSSHT
jgi:hypothetical protein